MDIPSLLPGDLDVVAARLDRCAARAEVCATQVRVATPISWQGRAAGLHAERVGELADDLVALATRLRGSAQRVRRLQSAALSRLDVLGDVDLTVAIRP